MLASHYVVCYIVLYYAIDMIYVIVSCDISWLARLYHIRVYYIQIHLSTLIVYNVLLAKPMVFLWFCLLFCVDMLIQVVRCLYNEMPVCGHMVWITLHSFTPYILCQPLKSSPISSSALHHERIAMAPMGPCGAV